MTRLPASPGASVRARAASVLASGWAVSLGLLLGACMSKDATPPPAPVVELPCDANRVLQGVCQKCHSATPQNGAPFPLVTYADTHVVASGRPIWQYMLTVVQNGIMPLPPVQIDAFDRDSLLRWLNAGAPARTASDSCSDPPADPGDAATDGDGSSWTWARDESDAALEGATDGAVGCSPDGGLGCDALPE